MSWNIKRRLVGTALAAVVAGSTAIASPAAAVEDQAEVVNSVTADQKSELSRFWDAYDVPEVQQDRLIGKLEAGEAWDVFRPSSAPVNLEQRQDSGEQITVERYSDGSIAVSSVPTPVQGQGVGNRSVRDCRVVSDHNATQYQTNCHAWVNLGVIGMGFYFDKITSPGQLGRITQYYGEHHHVVGGALSNHRLHRINGQKVRYSADCSLAFKGFPAGWTAWMQANLGIGNFAYTTHN